MKIKRTTVFLILFFALAVLAICLIPSNDDDYSITTIDDLSGKDIGVQNSTMYEVQVEEKNPEANILIFSDPTSMYLSLLQHKVDAIATEEITFNALRLAHPEIYALEEPLDSSPVGFAFAENDTGIRLYYEMEEYIAKCNEDGTRDRLDDYWVKNYNPDTCRSADVSFSGENGTIKVAMEAGFEGFSNMVEGRPCGFDVDYIYGFCREYGYTPEIVFMDFDGIAPAVSTGKCDMGTGIVLTADREESLLLSQVYYTNNLVFAVTGDTEDAGFFETVRNSFVKTFIKESRWKMFLQGTGITLTITIMSILIGTVLGFCAYLLIKDGDVVCKKILGTVSWIVEGLPKVVILLLLYYVIFGNKDISSTVTAIVGFSIVFACGVLDMIEGGVKAVDYGQYEAARAQGLSSNQTFFRIILPQVAFHSLPVFKSEVVSILQETSIVGYIAILDLTKVADMVRSRTFDAFFPLLATAAIYLLLIVILSALINLINPKIDIRKRKIPKDIMAMLKEDARFTQQSV